VLLPPLLPPLLTGTALAFSRALGEFGSIVIISSNFAFKVRFQGGRLVRSLAHVPCMGVIVALHAVSGLVPAKANGPGLLLRAFRKPEPGQLLLQCSRRLRQ
jgi:hypothetical protein